MLADFTIKNFVLVVIGTILPGIFVEYLNVFSNWWTYGYPWNQFLFYGVSPLTLIFGWFILGGISYFIAALIWDIVKKRETFLDTFTEVWFLAWVVMGFVFEIFNAYALKEPMWVYHGVWLLLVPPFLGFSLLVPIGYGITALICLLVIKRIT